jgi:hypothetical protein
MTGCVPMVLEAMEGMHFLCTHRTQTNARSHAVSHRYTRRCCLVISLRTCAHSCAHPRCAGWAPGIVAVQLLLPTTIS